MNAPSHEPETGLELNTAHLREILVGFVRDETRNAGFERAVVGVSGGVDSAVAVTIAAEALGPGNVLGLLLPHASGQAANEQDAAGLLGSLGVTAERVDITPVVNALEAGSPTADRVRKGNLMARARMILLYDRSARERGIVVGTSNKTELLLGYGTLHGDTACGINPLGDLYKTQVWSLARAIGVPQRIVEKKPSADLWEGQTDEEELGFSYGAVDRLLVRMVDERRSDEELLALGFEGNFITAVRERIRSTQYKRRLPLIAKVSARTINVDFRYPRDWGI